MSEIESIKSADSFEERESAFEASNSATPKKKDKRKRRKIVLNLKCPLCESGVKEVTYKDVYQLKKFTSVRGKIISTEKSGACARHQRQITKSVKRARVMGLLAYVAAE